MNFIEYFKENFYQKLLSPNNGNPVRNRADSLLKVFELLEQRNPFDNESESDMQYYDCAGSKFSASDVKIIETGTVRKDHGELSLGDDGASTFIFKEYIKFRNRGKLHSVDISEENCNYAKQITNDARWAANIHCGDSVKFLSSLPKEYKISLLYLDSMDVYKENPHPSALHCFMEFTSAIKNLTSESIICIDDANAFFDGGKTGKAMYVREYMAKIGNEPVFDGYQLVYKWL